MGFDHLALLSGHRRRRVCQRVLSHRADLRHWTGAPSSRDPLGRGQGVPPVDVPILPLSILTLSILPLTILPLTILPLTILTLTILPLTILTLTILTLTATNINAFGADLGHNVCQ